MSTVLELKNVNKAFGGVQAVHDMSFVINRGELAGLIGPNGAGKTTISSLRAITSISSRPFRSFRWGLRVPFRTSVFSPPPPSSKT